MKKKFTILCIVFLLLILILLNILDIPCIFHKLAGLYCPGCGITRMIRELLNLNFYQAFRYNPLCFILLPFLLIYIIYMVYIWFFNKEDKLTKKIPNSILYTLLFIIIIFGILRNIEYFNWLAPTKI